jgi:hypothetical protein
MRHTRRAQAALEFLTTYGWAILIVLVMSGTFAYFGFLNPSKLMPERCAGSPEMVCSDYAIDSTGKVSVIFKQTVGKTIFLTNYTCTYNTDTVANSAPFLAVPRNEIYDDTKGWSPRDQMRMECVPINASRASALQGQKAKVEYVITYRTSATGLDHSAEGEIIAEVQ